MDATNDTAKDRLPPADRCRLGLILFAGCFLAQAVLAIVPRVASTCLVASIASGSDDSGALEWMQFVFLSSQGLGWLLALGMTIGLWLYAAPQLGTARSLAMSSFGCWCGQILVETFYLIASLLQASGVHLGAGAWAAVWQIVFWLGLILEAGGLCCLILAVVLVDRSQAAPPRRALVGATACTAALQYGFNVLAQVGVLVPALRQDHPWISFSLYTAVSLGLAGTLLALLIGHSRRIATPRGAPAAASVAELPPAVGRGLRTYRVGLIWRLVILVGGMLLLLVTQLNQQIGATKVLLVLTSLGSLACGIAMLVGLIRFAGVPAATRIRGPAVVALVIMGIGVLLDLTSTLLVCLLFSSKHSLIMTVVKASPYLTLAGQVLGLAGIVALLTALLRLGTLILLDGVRERVRTIGVLLGFTLLLTIVARLVLQFSRPGLVAGLSLAGTALILAVVTLVLFLALTGRLLDKLGAK